MKTSVTGFPRIGALRELKFSIEQYFRLEIKEDQLLKVAKDIRVSQWLLQKECNIDYIASNDFSFYDGVLDMAVLLNVIPDRYKELQLSTLDTYFSMARGYQEKHGDVKALAMKKWFNTNYHYLVPEIEDDTQVKLNGTKIFDEYKEAKDAGVQTKPVMIGPFTFLKLTRYCGVKKAEDYIDAASDSYVEILDKLQELGAEWVQIDEPYLVHDLTNEDVMLFTSLYEKILVSKGNVKVLLQTYFGDIRDCYEQIAALDFDGIGLDFIEGKQTVELIDKYGFPENKILFAGLINGKNIWRNDYKKTLHCLAQLKNVGIETVIGTSCSLLHVPYTLEHEKRLNVHVKEHFAYAYEKLWELSELKKLSELQDAAAEKEYQNNQKLFTGDRKAANPKVHLRIAKIKDSDFIREPAFEQREQIQKKTYQLPLFPTTTIGSFPQTAYVKSKRTAHRKGQISDAEYEAFIKDKIAECIQFQEKIGFDVLVHGEYERNDMVEYFGEQLEGYLFTEKAWVQSYGTRCVKPPVIWGDISRKAPMTVAWSVYAQSFTDKPVKGMLTGPVTILNWSFPREDITHQECAYQIALAIRDEVIDLEQNGIQIIQVDEAALREKLPLRKSEWYSKYLDWAIPAFRLVQSGVKPETQIHTHMCYSEFTDIIPAIDDMDADVITFEASRSDLLILDALKDNHFKTEVGPGVYDIHSPRVPSIPEIIAALEKMAEKVDVDKLWVNPDCGLKTRGTDETEKSLINLVTAATACREKYNK
ncbi:MAG: 5-methyltetrahydropteroyltriglutamate--homocysteine S-methyltransferase [Anaerostipes sp.]|nr:5-methyltetrahydropteroyltriglutamate--homocysteine S-methyltransferase [Massilibacteroides sp.]MDD3747466.1 5-methyltetrahydropteroyltriglutamate--homocysteine S-methyltransferase [Anaerostipes sp.]